MNEPKIDQLELKRIATLLESQLIELAQSNEAAKSVLHRFSSLISEAKEGKIDSPYKYKFFPEEFYEDGELFSETGLAETAAIFGLALRGLNHKGHINA